MFLFSITPLLFQRFADAPSNCTQSFFGLPTWYKYLPAGDFQNCQIVNFNFPGDFSYVAISAIDIALTIAGMVAVFYVIWGGIQYVVSQGEPDKTRGAKNTITNALVGLVIAGVAISLVSFLGSQLGTN
jgi:hypothetical protein